MAKGLRTVLAQDGPEWGSGARETSGLPGSALERARASLDECTRGLEALYKHADNGAAQEAELLRSEGRHWALAREHLARAAGNAHGALAALAVLQDADEAVESVHVSAMQVQALALRKDGKERPASGAEGGDISARSDSGPTQADATEWKERASDISTELKRIRGHVSVASGLDPEARYAVAAVAARALALARDAKALPPAQQAVEEAVAALAEGGTGGLPASDSLAAQAAAKQPGNAAMFVGAPAALSAAIAMTRRARDSASSEVLLNAAQAPAPGAASTAATSTGTTAQGHDAPSEELRS